MCEPSTRLLDDTHGLATVEYVVILMLIAVSGFTAWQGFGATVKGKIGLSSEAIAGINPSGTGASGVGASMEGFAPPTTSGLTAPAPGDGAGATGDDASEAYRLGSGDGGGFAAGARGVADGAADFVEGVGDSLVAVNNAGWWLWEKAKHPLDSAAAVADAVSHAVSNPRETVQAAADVMAGINKGVYDAGADVVRACVGGDGYTCNRGVVNAGLNLLPGSAATTVLKGGKQIATAAATNRAVPTAAAATRQASRTAPDAAAVERAWPSPWPEPPPGQRVLSRQEPMSTDAITGSVQREVRRDIVDAKKAEIQDILDGGPGELPQVKMVPDPDNPGGHLLIDQNHTYQAYRELGFDEVPAQVYTDDGVDFLRDQLSYPNEPFPIGQMETVEVFSGTPAQQAAARRAAEHAGEGRGVP